MKNIIRIFLVAAVLAIGCGSDTVNDENDAATQETVLTDIKMDGSGPGDYDGTCYDCDTVCVNCDQEYEDQCKSECEQVQGYSDGFMWLESQLHKWGCDEDDTAWNHSSCP